MRAERKPSIQRRTCFRTSVTAYNSLSRKGTLRTLVPCRQFSRVGFLALVLLVSWVASAEPLLAQELSKVSPQLAAGPSPGIANVGYSYHRFWDRENICLFASVGAARSFDYASTLNMRRRGRQEVLLDNWVVDHHGLFAGIEVTGTLLSVGASYWLHRSGHHRMERWVSLVHFGMATTGAVRNYSLKTTHPDLLP
jgi:hypothetical protein